MGFTIPGTILRAPSFQSQRTGRKPPYVDCMWESAEMAIDHGSRGRLQISAVELRRVSGDKVGGSTINDVERGVRGAYGLDLPNQTLTRSQVAQRFESFEGGLLSILYGKLPRHFRRHSPYYQDGHGVFGRGIGNGKVWLMDPIANETGYRGELIDVDDLLKAMVWPTHPSLFYAALMQENDMINSVGIKEVFPEGPRPFSILKGTTIVAYAIDTRTGSLVERKRHKFDVPSAAKATSKVKFTTTRGLEPTGDFLEVLAGLFANMFIPLESVVLTDPPSAPPPVDCEPLKQDVAKRDQLIAEVIQRLQAGV